MARLAAAYCGLAGLALAGLLMTIQMGFVLGFMQSFGEVERHRGGGFGPRLCAKLASSKACRWRAAQLIGASNVDQMPVLGKQAQTLREWLDALRDFHDAGDRSHPFRFVGRGAELATLLRRAQLLRPSLTGRSPPKGASPRFAGPPGMGKTALAEEFVRLQQQAAAKPGASAATAVLATLDMLDGPPAHAACRLASRLPLPAAMLRRLLPDADARILRGVAKGGGLASFSSAAAHLMRGGDPAAVLMRQMGLSEHSDAITSLMALHPGFWPNGLVICVDEAQNLQPNSAPAGFLDAVHQNVRQAPVCFAAFGLPGLKKAFDDAGISRFTPNMPYMLGLLTEDEPSQLINLNLDALGLAARPGDGEPLADLARRNGFRTEQWAAWREDAVRRILDASGGFPHHLQNGVAAIAKLVADAGLDFHPRKVGHDALGREHEAMKQDYYEARLGAIGPHTLALGAAFAACGAGCPSSDAIVRAVQASTDKGVGMDGGTAESVVDRAVAKGILQTLAPDRDVMDVPIPSFREHLTQRFHAALAVGRSAATLLADNLGIDANSAGPTP